MIISNLEHNAVMRPLKKLKANFSVAEVGKNKSETLANFERLIKPNTRLIFVTGASNVTGQILPIKELGDLCKSKGILFGVDGAQIAGNRPINMQQMNIDFLCIETHKSLYAPMGIGILICRKPLENTILEGGTGTDSLDFSQPRILPEGMESGTINVPAIFGVSAGLDFVEKIGIERAYKHEFELLEMLYFGLSKNPYVTLYTAPPRFFECVPVLPFNYKDYDSFKTAAILNKNGFAVRGGFHCAPTAHRALKTGNFGAVRVSFGLFNTKNEVQSLLNLINSNNFS